MTIDPVSLAITAALTAAQMALQASKKIEGPRLDDLNVTLADYGTPIPYIYGIRRLEGVPIIWAEEIREQKRRRKTKGGKFNEYTYFGTWAVVVADHEIDAVTRIWFDKHLVYDATGAGPMTPLGTGSASADDETSTINLSDHIRIYTGTTTQEPDPRMLATVEAEQGAGSCPAYREIAYIVFEDVPLEKFGNRIPQISVEATSNGTATYPVETADTARGRPNDLHLFSWSPGYSRFLFNAYEIWDPAARSLMIDGSANLSGAVAGISNDGTIYSVWDTLLDPHVTVYSADGLSAGADIPLDHICEFAQVLEDAEGNEYVCVVPYDNQQDWIQYFQIGGLATPTPTSIDPGFAPTMYLADDAGNLWAVGGPHGSSDQVGFYCFVGDRAGENAIITAPTSHSANANVWAVHNGQGSFVVSHAGRLFLVDDTTFAIGTTVSQATVVSDLNRFVACQPGASSIWLQNKEISLTDLSTIRTVSYSDWGISFSGDEVIYDPVNHALILFNTSDEIKWLYLDRVASADVTLQDIVEDVATRCGVDAADLDASDLDQAITGYSWTQGSGKDIVGPLLDFYDSDARPHDFTLEFIKRDGTSAGTLDVGEYARRGDEDRYRITKAQDTDLPRIGTFSFADPAGDQQTNSVTVRRDGEATDSARELSINLTTLVLAVDDARQLAERYFRRQWNARYSYELSLTAQRFALEPGDVYTLALDSSIEHTARNTKLTVTGKENLLRCEWERDAAILATLTSAVGATFDGRRDQTVLVPQISKGFILDIPLIRDADNDTNPIVYYGAGPYSAGTWPGATFYRSTDGTDYEEEFASVPSTAGLTWGFANGALANATVAVWDRGNTLSVTVKNGELTSATEADIDASPTLNLALVGDELLNFTTATLVSEDASGKVYTLSGFKRGRRGTEWATSGHASGDQFILLDAVGAEEMGASDIGDILYFKAVTQGREVDSAFPILVDTYEGNSNKPYAPANLEGHRTGVGGDWVFSWNRRSRVGGRWTGNTTVPLGESAENYELDIMNGGSVVRTITATSETATWTTAQQTTDFGSAQSTVTARVRQVGDLMDGRNTTGTF